MGGITVEKKIKGSKCDILYIQYNRENRIQSTVFGSDLLILLLQKHITKAVQPAKAKRCISDIKQT